MKSSTIWGAVAASALLAALAEAGPVDLSDSGKATEPELTPAVVAPPSSPGRLTAIEENPTFSPNGKDRHYTNGVEVAYTTGQLADASLWSQPIRLLSGFLFNRPTSLTDNRLEWTVLGQSIFTPEDHTRANPDPKDRPFAGWLYTGLNFIQNTDDRQLTSLEILAGVVGPWGLGRQVQNAVHHILGEALVSGWNYQLHNEPGIMISWDRRWRCNHDLGGGYSWELIPEVGATVGNVLTYAEVGGLARLGRGLKADWGPDMVRPGYSGTSYFSAERANVNWGFDVYGGAQGRAVALNIFLDGNNFKDSRSVAKTNGVADLIAGIELFYRDRFRAGFTFVARTPEFYKQTGLDQFGGFNVSVGF